MGLDKQWRETSWRIVTSLYLKFISFESILIDSLFPSPSIPRV